jgi:putative hydrolase of the HAD superfamily
MRPPDFETSSPHPPRVIFFDAAGTLIYLPRSVGSHYSEVATRFGALVDPAALDAAFRTAWREMPDRLAQDGPRPGDDRGWWRELVQRVLDRVLDLAQAARFPADAYFETLYDHFAQPGVWELFNDVPRALAALRERGVRLAVISNFDRRLLAIFRHLGIDGAFECVILSSETGADKPDPRIFRIALEKMGVAPEDALHVGDDPRRDGGASAVGLAVFHVARPQRSLDDLLAQFPDLQQGADSAK